MSYFPTPISSSNSVTSSWSATAQSSSYADKVKINFITTSIDFGHSGSGENTDATVSVSASWVSPTSVIMVTVDSGSIDHSLEDALYEGLTFSVGNIVNGVSFDIYAYAINQTWGQYNLMATEIKS